MLSYWNYPKCLFYECFQFIITLAWKMCEIFWHHHFILITYQVRCQKLHLKQLGSLKLVKKLSFSVLKNKPENWVEAFFVWSSQHCSAYISTYWSFNLICLKSKFQKSYFSRFYKVTQGHLSYVIIWMVKSKQQSESESCLKTWGPRA